MRRVRQKDTTAERRVAETLRGLGAAYRKNVRSLPGSPDFANRGRKWAVFVHGCFWHQHEGCKRATVPKANSAFWLDKFARNKARDATAVSRLEAAGFRVAVIWECELDAARANLSKVLEARRVDVREAVDH
jgi:DNA mismatch endonuclease Vsr